MIEELKKMLNDIRDRTLDSPGDCGHSELKCSMRLASISAIATKALDVLRDSKPATGLPQCGWPGCAEKIDPRWFARVNGETVAACDGHGGYATDSPSCKHCGHKEHAHDHGDGSCSGRTCTCRDFAAAA